MDTVIKREFKSDISATILLCVWFLLNKITQLNQEMACLIIKRMYQMKESVEKQAQFANGKIYTK